MSVIKIRNLTKRFEDAPVLTNVNLEIEKGEAVVIIGGSGGGKSTLLRCMNRLVIPDEGEIYIDGENILDKNADIDAIRRKMGMVYQHFNLFSHLNVLDNIILAPIKVAGMEKEAAVAEARQLLEKVGMSGREKAMPESLSGGQRQRVAIARTLAMHPSVILFDEPTSSLDPTMVDEVESVIKHLVSEGLTCVIVTHEMRFARRVASRIIFMAENRIYEEGTPEQVFDHPRRPLTQRFLFRSRMFETEIKSESLDLYALASALRAFLNNYESETRQEKLILAVCDELLYPVFRGGEAEVSSCSVRLLCSETSTRHTMLISFRGIDSDPLGEPFLDELNLRLLNNYADYVFSRKTETGWEVCIQM
ncbi:MAG: amino acid ABC transporter ATP-binding protein [Oscillospiraceae bacterium]|nr:amino acid ABC transporter ATP-binding protein [Oscillospiraceae bacterium]